MKSNVKLVLGLFMLIAMGLGVWAHSVYGPKGLPLAFVVGFVIPATIYALAKESSDPDSPLNIPYSEERDRRQWP